MLGFGTNCYFITNADTWANTQSACAAQGASLATINSAPENEAISAAFTQTLWIGLSRQSPNTVPVTCNSALYAWIVPTNSSYANWGANQPDCYNNVFGVYEGCATINSYVGLQKWNDEQCTSIHPGLCKYEVQDWNAWEHAWPVDHFTCDGAAGRNTSGSFGNDCIFLNKIDAMRQCVLDPLCYGYGYTTAKGGYYQLARSSPVSNSYGVAFYFKPKKGWFLFTTDQRACVEWDFFSCNSFWKFYFIHT